MVDRAQVDHWVGRLVRVLVVFRALILLITLLLVPNYTPVIGLAGLAAAIVSYIPIRHWDRIAPTVARHPGYVAVEMLLATLILAAAGARSSFFYFTLGTAAIVGVVYGRRGALPFSALLIALYELVALEGFPSMHPLHDALSTVFVPALYPLAIGAGIAAREQIERGAATEVLLRDRTEALAAERERLRVARELHDSLAKTVEGVALSASVLKGRCERNPAGAALLADQLAGDAREAALQARALMSDLRPVADEGTLADAVRLRAEGFADRAGALVHVDDGLGDYAPELSPRALHELLSILGEALINADRHGDASRIVVALRREREGVALTVTDDGPGIEEPVDLDALKAAGHYGLAGMHERAEAAGGALKLGSALGGGTVVALWVPELETDRELDAAKADGKRGSWTRVTALLRRKRVEVTPSARVKA